MYIVINTNEFIYTNVFFKRPVKNNIIEKSDFMRLLYSDDTICTTGLFLVVPIYIDSYQLYNNKYKCLFKIKDNEEKILALEQIERDILNHVNIQGKTMRYNISNNLRNCMINIYKNYKIKHRKDQFIIKISGIWVTDGEYGLTYKVLDIPIL